MRTKKGFPFLMYNCAERISSLRRDFPKTRAGINIEWRLRRAVVALDFQSELIDPYDVAGLIALAQEQRAVFFRLNQTTPEILKVGFISLAVQRKYWVFTISSKVHLISPHPSHAAVYHYTAKIPLQYLNALHNPRIKVEKTVLITRQLVDLPTVPPPRESTIKGGPFLDMVAQILEEALDYEKPRPKPT